jgi:hypothetical protein
MAFFRNRAINLLNLHYVIEFIGIGGGGAFFSIYLLKSGLTVPVVLLVLAAIMAMRLILRSFLLGLGLRVGLRWLVVIGTVLMASMYPFLVAVHGVGFSLYRLIFISALADTVYWPSYHAYFAALGDEEHRGQQTGIREVVTAALGIVSPLVAGWLLVTFGPRAAFFATGAIQFAAVIPLFWMPDIAIARSAPGAFRAAINGAMLFVADGWVAAGYFIVWQIALFLALGQSYMAYGGALAVAALVGAVGGLVFGRLIDSGRGTRAVWLSVSLLALVVAMRAGALHHPVLAVIANALGSLVACVYVPTLMTAVYNQGKRSPCVLRFHIAAEGGWDIGVMTALLLAAAITWSGYSIGFGILIAMAGAATVGVLLHRYYTRHNAETIDASRVQPEEAL